MKKIKEILNKQSVSYEMTEIPEHVGNSVDEHVKYLNISYAQAAATLIFKTDKGFIALIRRDYTNIDTKKIKVAVGIKKIRIATDKELKETTGCLPGSVTSIGLDIPVYMDKKVLERDLVHSGTGNPRFTLKISPKDLQRVSNAQVGDFTTFNYDRSDQKDLRILSGITPSSSKGLHLGNYLGAVKPQVDFQKKGHCFYFVADYHALNTVFDPEQFEQNVRTTVLDFLSLGIDTTKTTFYVQSDIEGIPELQTILNNVVTVGEMKRMHAFKDKLAKGVTQESINMGLFNYPILMSADILVMEPDVIPVGKDQQQHVEICRDIAESFNSRYGDTLKVPKLYLKKEVATVIGIDGERKMSKSLGNDIPIFESEKAIKKQIMSITTDPARIHPDDPGDPAKNPIFTYLDFLDYDPKEVGEMKRRYTEGSIKDVEIKNTFFSFFMDYFKPFRETRLKLEKNKQEVDQILKKGAKEANAVADKTIGKIRSAVGIDE